MRARAIVMVPYKMPWVMLQRRCSADMKMEELDPYTPTTR